VDEAMILYTDIEPFCCDVLRARVADGGLLPGDVWERDVRTLTADELKPYTQVHLFCGIGASPLGLKWAGWPAELSVVTGGFPCTDISVAGKGAGIDGPQSGLWKEMHRVIDIVRPRWVIAENVPALRTRGIDRVLGDMERIGYQCWPLVVGADDVGAPHRRKRVWIVCRMADTDDATSSAELVSVCAGGEEAELAGSGGVADAERDGRRAGCVSGWTSKSPGRRQSAGSVQLGDTEPTRLEGHRPDAGQSQLAESRYASPRRWPVGPGQEQHDWEAPRLAFGEVGNAAHGLPGRLARTWNRHALKALGNAQVPENVRVIARAILHTEAMSERSST
jgi:DNA (cytosine-5)-methyltransferase 1